MTHLIRDNVEAGWGRRWFTMAKKLKLSKSRDDEIKALTYVKSIEMKNSKLKG